MTKLKSILLLFLFLISINSYGQIYINEIMASNSNTVADEAGEFDDWVEIYNAGGSDINLGGYFISDDPSDLQKWAIPMDNPAMTNVPAGGFLILWADKDPEQGTHHIDFKLSGSGETLIVTAPDGISAVDQVTFGPQTQDISYGRTMDGDTNFQLFSTPTPGISNNGSSGGLTYPVELLIPVLSDFEDATESQDGTVEVEDFGLQMGQDFGGNSNTVGLRFQLDLPQGAIVNNAFIKFTSAAPNEIDPAEITISAELINDAPAFNTTNFNVSQRDLTTASVLWQPLSWDFSGMNGGVQNDSTSNIAPVLQEVVNQSNWEAGNSIVIIFTGTGRRSCFQGGTCCSPSLTIEGEIPFPNNPIENLFINELAAAGTNHVDEGGDREDWIDYIILMILILI